MFANPNQPGSYVGWTPCSTLRYRLNLAAAPTTATADVTEALRRITLLTGLRFSYLGTTDYVPSATNPGTYPADTDLVITWSDAATVPALAGSVIGVGGAYVTYSAPAHLLRGGVSLDRQAGLPAGFGSGATMGHCCCTRWATCWVSATRPWTCSRSCIRPSPRVPPPGTRRATGPGSPGWATTPACSAPRAVAPDRTHPADAHWVQIT